MEVDREDFQRLRARLDPDGAFRNHYLDRVLRPIARLPDDPEIRRHQAS